MTMTVSMDTMKNDRERAMLAMFQHFLSLHPEENAKPEKDERCVLHFLQWLVSEGYWSQQDYQRWLAGVTADLRMRDEKEGWV